MEGCEHLTGVQKYYARCLAADGDRLIDGIAPLRAIDHKNSHCSLIKRRLNLVEDQFPVTQMMAFLENRLAARWHNAHRG